MVWVNIYIVQYNVHAMIPRSSSSVCNKVLDISAWKQTNLIAFGREEHFTQQNKILIWEMWTLESFALEKK
jgi:hypothetical protein